jgi:hypothetical protein
MVIFVSVYLYFTLFYFLFPHIKLFILFSISLSVTLFDYEDWRRIIQIMQKNEKTRIIPKRIEIETTKILKKKGNYFGEVSTIEVADTKTNYLNEIKKSFDLNRIKNFLAESEIFLTIDCLNSPISNYLLPILNEIGLDDSCLLNSKFTSDFNGKIPTPNIGKNSICLSVCPPIIGVVISCVSVCLSVCLTLLFVHALVCLISLPL